MPRGAQAFTKHAAAKEQRREKAFAAFGPRADYFGLDHAQFAVVRFLEQGDELTFGVFHRVRAGNSKYPNDVLCLDQEDDGTPCPFCQSDDKEVRGRSTKGLQNVIWRGGPGIQAINQSILAQNQQRIAQSLPPYATYQLAPVFKRNQQGVPEKDSQTKRNIVTGYADGVFLWKCSNTVFQQLLEKDAHFHGLMSRDFTIRRQGSTMNDTVYYIDPYDVNAGPVPMSAADMALAGAKYDLSKFTTPLDYETAAGMLAGQIAVPGAQETFMRGGPPPPPGQLMPASPQAGAPMASNPFEPGQPPMPASQPPVAPPSTVPTA